eukprot:8874891-Lingulodinium_polyedra.AAC.1
MGYVHRVQRVAVSWFHKLSAYAASRLSLTSRCMDGLPAVGAEGCKLSQNVCGHGRAPPMQLEASVSRG